MLSHIAIPNGPTLFGCQLEHFASVAMTGVGPGTVRLLQENGLLSSVSDFFRLDLKTLEALPGLGEKRASKLVDAMEV